MFATDEGLRWLAYYPDWHLFGTFTVAPTLFTQVFTIHVVCDHQTVPCLYCLLPYVCRQIMALPFIPVADVNQAYIFIEQVAAENRCGDLHELFVNFRGQRNEIDAVLQEIWNSRCKDMRTINSLEGFHSRFNRLVGEITQTCGC